MKYNLREMSKPILHLGASFTVDFRDSEIICSSEAGALHVLLDGHFAIEAHGLVYAAPSWQEIKAVAKSLGLRAPHHMRGAPKSEDRLALERELGAPVRFKGGRYRTLDGALLGRTIAEARDRVRRYGGTPPPHTRGKSSMRRRVEELVGCRTVYDNGYVDMHGRFLGRTLDTALRNARRIHAIEQKLGGRVTRKGRAQSTTWHAPDGTRLGRNLEEAHSRAMSGKSVVTLEEIKAVRRRLGWE